LNDKLQEQEYLLHLEKVKFIYKFQFFFTGLVFAILSFSIQYSTNNENIIIKFIEISSWIFLFVSGIFSIKNIGGFVLDDTNKYQKDIYLNKKERFTMWITFVLGVIFLLVSKIWNMF